MFLGQFLFELSCRKTHRNTHTHTTDAHKHSDDNSIVAFCKNTTIIETCIFCIYRVCTCIPKLILFLGTVVHCALLRRVVPSALSTTLLSASGVTGGTPAVR